jgi:hypothetical protein
MLELIRPKVRALIQDFGSSGFESFVYRNTATFTLAEENINAITKVFLNGTELGTGEYSFDSSTNRITISVTGLSNSDIIQVYYTYYKYSDNEIKEYVRGALVWITYGAYKETDYELEEDDVYPTPDNRTIDLIALITAILIKPDYNTYRLPTVTVVYGGRMPKDDKIEKLVSKFYYGIGISGVIEFD